MMKMRKLRDDLRKQGFLSRRGKGSHEVWWHPRSPWQHIVLYGKGGDDVKKYQSTRVRKFRKGMMVYN